MRRPGLTILKPESILRNTGSAFFRAPTGWFAMVGLLLLAFLAIFGPILWGHAGNVLNVIDAGEGPSTAHWLGTDRLGRDILARTLTASRLSLKLGFSAAALSAVVGIPT